MNATAQSRTHRTVTVIVPAARDQVFAFLANPENLPVWATEFCEKLKREGAHYKVVTSGGELFFRVEADLKTEVIDMFSGPTLTEQGLFPCRVPALHGHGTAIVFTFFHTADIPDEMCFGVFLQASRLATGPACQPWVESAGSARCNASATQALISPPRCRAVRRTPRITARLGNSSLGMLL